MTVPVRVSEHDLLGLLSIVSDQSEGTVRKHMENIFARLHVTNRTAAIAHAFPTAPY